MQEDIIVEIPENRKRYFGCSGKMLLPSMATVSAYIQTIPENKVITTDMLQKALAKQFNVEVTCPIATKKALRAIASDGKTHIAYWRVLKKNGELFSQFPGGRGGHAINLIQGGFSIDTTGKNPRVKNFDQITYLSI